MTVVGFFQVNCVVFDKTGTITHGKPSVAQLTLLVGHAGYHLSLSALLAIFGAAEGGSEHPLATAIVKFASKALGSQGVPGASLTAFKAVPGCGVEVKVSGVEAAASKGASSEEMMNFENSSE